MNNTTIRLSTKPPTSYKPPQRTSAPQNSLHNPTPFTNFLDHNPQWREKLFEAQRGAMKYNKDQERIELARERKEAKREARKRKQAGKMGFHV